MSENLNSHHDRWPALVPATKPHFSHPDDVLNDANLSTDEKRGILASWASDANSVENAPALRQLASGAVVGLADILTALNHLADADPGDIPDSHRQRSFRLRPVFSLVRRSASLLVSANDDDDDPPSSPVAASPPTRPLKVNAQAA